ncbi:hypothetical protein MASR2M17_08760 [Aminivibrio sp.]
MAALMMEYPTNSEHHLQGLSSPGNTGNESGKVDLSRLRFLIVRIAAPDVELRRRKYLRPASEKSNKLPDSIFFDEL